jgi:putative ABC transport system permease protein
MLKNYSKIAFRHLMKQRLHSIITIAGLTVGMAVSILILSYVWFEHSFDRFHSKSDQTYRVVQTMKMTDSTLKEECPEILHTARLADVWDAEISYNEKKVKVMQGEGIIRADNDIFNIFDIVLVYGDSETALQDPNSIILTEEESRKFFGNENPMGKFISINNPVTGEQVWNLEVTGVAKAMPDNSHFEFKYLIPYDKISFDVFNFAEPIVCTYLTLPVDYPPENLENKFPQIVSKYFAFEIERKFSIIYDEWLESGGYWKLRLQPLKHIHLDRQLYDYESGILKKKGNLLHVQIYTVIALFIIALACINFITLSTARSGVRAKEVGLRKVNGATRRQLIWQFLTESVVLSLIALMFAVIMVTVFFKPFNKLLEIQTSHNMAGILFIVTSLFVVTLIVGVVAGSYPAFFLSAFRPVEVLKGQLLEKMKGMAIRNSLVIFQFLISMILIISSISVYKQFVYMQNKDLGFEKENIVIIKNIRGIYYEDPELSWDERYLKVASLHQEVLKHPNVVTASLAEEIPGKFGYWSPKYVRPEGAAPETKYGLRSTQIDHSYLDVFDLEMAAGQNFRKSFTISQKREGVILNEKAADRLGLKNPVGKYIETEVTNRITTDEGVGKWVREEDQIPIIGVFEDFHTRDLHQDTEPIIFFPQAEDMYSGYYIFVRFLPGNVPDNISFLEKTWNKMGFKAPFEYSFFDIEFETLYNKEKKLAQVFTFFTILAIFIACLGIYGLAAFTAEQRTKEIGIRKVMGASVRNIVKILSGTYFKLLIVATLIACPLGYIIMEKWLQGFAFHINIGTGIFVFTVLITIIIVLSSVSYQSVKAALKNPASTLKYE